MDNWESDSASSVAEPSDPSSTPFLPQDVRLDSGALTPSLIPPTPEAEQPGSISDNMVKILLEKLLDNTEQIRQMQVTLLLVCFFKSLVNKVNGRGIKNQ